MQHIKRINWRIKRKNWQEEILMDSHWELSRICHYLSVLALNVSFDLLRRQESLIKKPTPGQKIKIKYWSNGSPGKRPHCTFSSFAPWLFSWHMGHRHHFCLNQSHIHKPRITLASYRKCGSRVAANTRKSISWKRRKKLCSTPTGSNCAWLNLMSKSWLIRHWKIWNRGSWSFSFSRLEFRFLPCRSCCKPSIAWCKPIRSLSSKLTSIKFTWNDSCRFVTHLSLLLDFDTCSFDDSFELHMISKIE